MKLAIVILNWNGAAWLRRFLPEVADSCRRADGTALYVADQASADDSLAYIAATHPSVRTIILDRNYGFAEGYNRALRTVSAEYYLLLNSDVRPADDWLEPLIRFMDTHPEAAACQPKLLSEAEPEKFEYAGAAGGWIDKWGYPYCRGRVMASVETDQGQYDTVEPCLWATGAALMVRSKDYWAAGGLDPRFFAHSEEIDLCWRLRIAGRLSYCVPQSVVWHAGGGTLSKSNPQKTYLNFRNNLTMLYKCLPERRLRKVMAARRLLDTAAALQMLLTGHPADARAVVRARRDFRRWRPRFVDDRRRIQALRTADDELPELSVLWQYYAKGRKKYSLLKTKKPE